MLGHANDGVDVVHDVLSEAAVCREPVRPMPFGEISVVATVIEA
jgi:hypothetical protein